jgi:hypothetical protein
MGNSIAQSGAIRAQGRYAQTGLENNAQLAELAAQDATKRGRLENAKLLQKAGDLVGTQRTSYAGQGVDVNAGSAADVQADTAAQAAKDALTLQNNAYREGWGHRVEAQNYRNAARMTHLGARNDANMTLLSGGLGFSRDVMNGLYLKEKYKTKGGGPAPEPDSDSYWTD